MSLPTIEEFPLEQVENFTEDQLRDFIEITYCGNDRRSSTRFFPIPTSIQKIDLKQQKNYGKLRGIYRFVFGFKEYDESQVFPPLQSRSFTLCLCDCGKWNIVKYGHLYSNSVRSCGECKPLGYNIGDFKDKNIGKFDITDTRIEKIYNNIYDAFKEENVKNYAEQKEFFDKIITHTPINGIHFLFLDNNGNIDDKNIKRHRLLSIKNKELRLAKLDLKGKLIRIYDKYEDFMSDWEYQHAKLYASYSPFFDYPNKPYEGQIFWRYVDKNDNILNYKDIFPFLKYDITDDTPVVKQNLEGKIIEYYNNLEDCALKEPFSKDVIEICCKAGNLFLNDITYSFYDKEKEFVIPSNRWINRKTSGWLFCPKLISLIKLDEYGLPCKIFDQEEKAPMSALNNAKNPKSSYKRIRSDEKLQIFTTKDFKCNVDYIDRAPKPTKSREEAMCKRVAQIDIDTKKILKVYHSIKEAMEETGAHEVCIGACCRHGKPKTAGGFIWRLVDENGNIVEPLSDHEMLKTVKTKGCRPVVKLSLDGEELERYPSIAEAARKNEGAFSPDITKVCKGIKKISGGFKWKYAEEVDKKDE